MTAPRTIQTAEEKLAALRAQNAMSAEEKLAALRQQSAGPSPREREARKRAREATNATEKEALNTPSTSVVNLLDALTFGGAGLATDALSPGSFRANRDARKSIYESMPASERTLLGVAGGIGNPVNYVLPGAKAFATTGRAIGSGAAVGGATGLTQYVGENIGTTGGVDPVGAAFATGIGTAGGALLAPIAARMARPKNAPVGKRFDGADVGPTPPTGPGLPEPIGLDILDPKGLASVRGATGTTEGREALRAALEAREAAMGKALAEGIPDAEATRQSLIVARRVLADQLYPPAIAATKGIPITGKAVDELIIASPTGRAAWKKVRAERPDIVVGTGDRSRKLPVVGKSHRPDAEAIHRMKEIISEWASAGEGYQFPTGVDAGTAKAAGKLFDRVRDLMPTPFKVADAAYAEASKPIDAIALGLQKWKGNAGRKPNAIALTNVERDIAGMTPEAQRAVREAKQFDLATRIRNAPKSVEKVAGLLRDPGTDVSRELNIAGGPLKERIPAWAEAARRKSAVLPEGATTNPPDVETVGSKGFQSVGPTPRVTAVRTARTLGGDFFKKSAETVGKEDKTLVDLVAGKPDALRKFLAKYRKEDRARQVASLLAAGSGGRMGLLFNTPFDK